MPTSTRSVALPSVPPDDPPPLERSIEADHWLLEVVEAMPDGVVIVDEQGEIVLVNREIERLLGWSRDDLLGLNSKHRCSIL